MKNGHAPIRVSHVDARNRTLSGEYNSGYIFYDRRWEDFVPYKSSYSKPKETQSMSNTRKLYQTKPAGDTPVEYGVYLATNSAGRIVLEMKGTAQVRDFATSDIEEVRPYTVAVDFAHNDGKIHHIEVSKDVSLEVGDFLIVDGDFGVVKQLDTKANRTMITRTVHRIPAEKIL